MARSTAPPSPAVPPRLIQEGEGQRNNNARMEQEAMGVRMGAPPLRGRRARTGKNGHAGEPHTRPAAAQVGGGAAAAVLRPAAPPELPLADIGAPATCKGVGRCGPPGHGWLLCGDGLGRVDWVARWECVGSGVLAGVVNDLHTFRGNTVTATRTRLYHTAPLLQVARPT